MRPVATERIRTALAAMSIKGSGEKKRHDASAVGKLTIMKNEYPARSLPQVDCIPRSIPVTGYDACLYRETLFDLSFYRSSTIAEVGAWNNAWCTYLYPYVRIARFQTIPVDSLSPTL